MFARTTSGYIQIGIGSGGIGCAARNYPGVYTEVNNPRIKSFIDAQLGNATSNNQTVNISQSNNQVVNISQSGN
jgi:secreted trypsin-like serine protease